MAGSRRRARHLPGQPRGIRTPCPEWWREDYDEAFAQPTQPDFSGCLDVDMPEGPEWLGDLLGPDGEVLLSVYAPANPVGFSSSRKDRP